MGSLSALSRGEKFYQQKKKKNNKKNTDINMYL